MKTSKLAAITSVIAIACAAFTYAPSTQAADSSASSGTASDATSGGPDAPLAAFNERVDAAGALGVYTDDGGALVVVVPASRSSSFVMPDASGLDTKVTEKLVDIDPARLSAALERLPGALQGPKVTSGFFFDPRLAKIVVHASADEAVVAQKMGDLFDLVEYHDDGVVALSRFADTSPFWGGSAVEDGVHQCTTGFAVLSGTVEKLVTAAHCFTSGANVYSPGNSNQIGTTGNVHCTNADYEWIGGKDYAGEIYIGGYTGTGSPVKGANDPTTQGNYFWSGEATFENPAMILSTSASITEDVCTGTITNVFSFRNPVGGLCGASAGDSGAPFFIKSGADNYIRGIVITKTGDGKTCFGVKWSTIRDGLGVTIETS